MNNKKLLQGILNNPKNVRFNDFAKLMMAFGFVSKRTSGSHNIYRNQNIPELINVQNVNGEAKPYQIKQFLAIVEKYNLKLEDD